MAITTAVTRKLNNNCVQVDVNAPGENTRYYKVPKTQADSFRKEYVKNKKSSNNLSSVLMFGSVFGTMALALTLTKNMASKGLKYVVCGLSAISIGTIAIIAGQREALKSHNKLLKKHNAQEIYYENNRLII